MTPRDSSRAMHAGGAFRRRRSTWWCAACAVVTVLLTTLRSGASEPISVYDLRAGAWDRSVELELAGDPAAARALLERAYGAKPTIYEVAVRLAWLCLLLREGDRAVELYRLARTLPGAGPEANAGLASACVLKGYQDLDAGELAAARRAFRDALELQPDRAEARRGLELAREQHFDPEIWGGYLAEEIGDFEATGWLVFVRLPYRFSDHFELGAAYRHNDVALRSRDERGPMATRQNGERSTWRQDELYASAGFGVSWLWLDVTGIALRSTSEGVVGGEAVRARLGRRFGLIGEQAALRRDAGWNVQVGPAAFWWPTRSLALTAGARLTDDHIGREVSGRGGVRLLLPPLDVSASGHLGRERWPVSAEVPMVVTVEQDLWAGASLTALVTLSPGFAFGMSGQLEQLEDSGTRGLYGSVAAGLRWSVGPD